MKKKLLLIPLALWSGMLCAQDSTWSKVIVDENLTIALPNILSQTDTTIINKGEKYRFKYINAETEHAVLNVLCTPNETNINVNNPESLKKALDGMAKGSMTSFTRQGFSCVVYDTIISKIAAKRISCTRSGEAGFECYLFLLNDKMYAFQAGINNADNPNKGRAELNQLLNSIRIKHGPVKEQQFTSRSEALGYTVGKLIIPILIIVFVLLRVFRKKRPSI